MHKEATKTVEEATLEERSNLIPLVSAPQSCDDKPASNDHKVEESSCVHKIKTEINDGLFPSNKLDKEGFCERFDYILVQWIGRSDFGLNGYGWIFKLVLWCLR